MTSSWLVPTLTWEKILEAKSGLTFVCKTRRREKLSPRFRKPVPRRSCWILCRASEESCAKTWELDDVSQIESVGIRASIPSNPDAMRLYSEGLAKLRTFDALALATC